MQWEINGSEAVGNKTGKSQVILLLGDILSSVGPLYMYSKTCL